jgi:hypothetical protein
MRLRPRATIEDLRQAIECLPRATRIAMLEGIESNEIIVGAYSDGGGICPMLAAHRAGGRTNAVSFARAWDRFAFRDARTRFGIGARRKHPARRASARELLVLEAHLEASLLDDDGPAEALAAAAAEHRRLLAARNPPAERGGARETTHPGDPNRIRPGDPNRTRELRSRPGWAWTRIVRTHDDYELVLEHIAREREPAGRRQREYEPTGG